jgi:hypothetical protein
MLEQWVIYKTRNGFEALKWLVDASGMLPDDVALQAKTLAQIRLKIPQGLSRLERIAGDHKSVVEVWM